MNTPKRVSGALAGTLLALSAGLTSCARPSSSHDVAYYRAHTEERTRLLADCANDPGARVQDPDCVNATEAARLEGIGSWKSLPPLNLPAANPKPHH